MNLDPKSTMLIYSNIGLDLEMIQKALEKLSIRSNKQYTIKVDDVEKYIGFSKEYNNFELQNSIGEKKFDKSIFIINQICFFCITKMLRFMSNIYNRTFKILNLFSNNLYGFRIKVRSCFI